MCSVLKKKFPSFPGTCFDGENVFSNVKQKFLQNRRRENYKKAYLETSSITANVLSDLADFVF